MKTKILLFLLTLSIIFSSCEKDKTPTDFIDFEKFALGQSGYWNGSDGSGGFTIGNAFFRNIFNEQFQSWSGFAVSNHTDNLTPGYANQYSSIEGSGADGSAKYAVLYSFSTDTITFLVPEKITNIALCNSTYAYFAMLNGDDFSVKYGGESGNDPDFLTVSITGVSESGNATGTFEISLADFRNENGTPDFIGNIWTDVDLSQLGFVKYLIFSFDSSRKNEWGILTPTYVCIDNIKGELAD